MGVVIAVNIERRERPISVNVYRPAAPISRVIDSHRVLWKNSRIHKSPYFAPASSRVGQWLADAFSASSYN
jgi:hypothetical protein